MITYYAKFIFNKNVSEILRNFLTNEFVKRRNVAVNILSEEFYKAVNAEFNALHPEKDGYSKEYAEFITMKQLPALEAANKADIGWNLVKLIGDPEECGDIIGICERIDTEIRLVLEPRVEV